MQTGPTVALIVAAGTGVRSGSSLPKQYAPIAGRAMIAHAHAALDGWARRKAGLRAERATYG